MKDVGWLVLTILIAHGGAAVAPIPRSWLPGRVGALVGWFTFPALAAVDPDHKRRLLRPERPRPQVLRLLGGTVGVATARMAVMALSRIGLVRSSFALNHVVMLPTFVLAIESLPRALCGLERLAGFATTAIVRNAYRARTPRFESRGPAVTGNHPWGRRRGRARGRGP